MKAKKVLNFSFTALAAATLFTACTSSKVAPAADSASREAKVDTSIDLSHAKNEYGTSVAPNDTVSIKADTSTSLIMDLRSEESIGESSANYAEENTVYKTTVYADGNHKGELLELKAKVLYHPEAKKASPAVLVIPGGGFMRCSTESLPVTRNYLANKGYAVISVEYRLVGTGTYKDAIADAHDAIRWVRANAAKYNLDSDNISLLGNSAGGYMVAITALTRGLPEYKGENNLGYSTDVNCVIDLYGLSDLTQVAADYPKDVQAAHALPTTSEAQFVNGVFSGKSVFDDLEETKKANPITYAGRGKDMHFLLMQGDSDVIVSPSQTVLLHNALKESGVDSTRYSLVGASHGGKDFDKKTVFETIISFIEKNRK